MAKLQKKGMSLEEKMARILVLNNQEKEIKAEKESLRDEVLAQVQEQGSMECNGYEFVEEKYYGFTMDDPELVGMQVILKAKIKAWEMAHRDDKNVCEEKTKLVVRQKKGV